MFYMAGRNPFLKKWCMVDILGVAEGGAGGKRRGEGANRFRRDSQMRSVPR